MRSARSSSTNLKTLTERGCRLVVVRLLASGIQHTLVALDLVAVDEFEVSRDIIDICLSSSIVPDFEPQFTRLLKVAYESCN